MAELTATLQPRFFSRQQRFDFTRQSIFEMISSRLPTFFDFAVFVRSRTVSRDEKLFGLISLMTAKTRSVVSVC